MVSFWNRFKEFVGLGEEPLEQYEEADYSTLYQEENNTNPRNEDRRSRLDRLQQPGGQPAPTPATKTEEAPRRRTAAANNNVIGLPNAASQAEVFVIEPKGFEEAPQLVQYLRERKSLVLNLTLMDSEQAQRTVDFVAGATYALDGHQERLGDGIFLFTPSSVLIATGTRPEVTVPTGAFKFDRELWQSGT